MMSLELSRRHMSVATAILSMVGGVGAVLFMGFESDLAGTAAAFSTFVLAVFVLLMIAALAAMRWRRG